MEITYITLQDVSKDGLIKFVSQSVQDILGYTPDEMANRSVWDFIHPDEVPQALGIYEEDLQRDFVASVHRFHLRHKRGHYVYCESVATVVFNVLIASTTCCVNGPARQRKSADAGVVQKLFESNRDSGFLSSIARGLPSPSAGPRMPVEPRAAMILNRYTRMATIIYATSNTPAILGLTPKQLVSTSFYYCVAECSMRAAVQCIEGSKASDTVSYLRFWFRNPQEEDMEGRRESVTGADESEDDMQHSPVSTRSPIPDSLPSSPVDGFPMAGTAPIEVEAVVTCSSDGIIVVLRRATGPTPAHFQDSGHPVYMNPSRPSSSGPFLMLRCSRDSLQASGQQPKTLVTSVPDAAAFGIRGWHAT